MYDKTTKKYFRYFIILLCSAFLIILSLVALGWYANLFILEMLARDELIEHYQSQLFTVTLIVGALLAFLCCLAVYYAYRARHSLSFVSATLDATSDGILSVDNDGEIVSYNQKFSELWEIPSIIVQAGSGRDVLQLMLSELKEPEVFSKRMIAMANSPQMTGMDELHFKDGRIFEYYSQPEQMNGNIIGRVWSFRNITQRKQMENQLLYQATHDILTGLPNRVLLIDRIQQALIGARRHESLVAILFFDLDGFKLINNSLGHDMGDRLLQIVADRMQKNIRDSDTVARLGGDEFVVVLTNLKHQEDAIPIVQKCLRAIQKLIYLNERELSVTCSVGISVYSKDGTDVHTLLKNADAAMYRAKMSGRNNFQFYTAEMNERAIERLELEQDLRYALEHNEFRLHYQPCVNLKTGMICGLEVLIRWQHPTLGLILPPNFIFLAEEIGLIVPIGEWVLRTACKQNKIWQENGINVPIAINLSAHQFRQHNLVTVIRHVLQETKMPASYLQLELTESIIMEPSKETLQMMHGLKKMGISLVIDDFGTGYSNLSYLQRFPLDKLKIDQSFIRDIAVNADMAAIVLAIIALGKSLNLRIIAEGVETKSQLAFLQAHQCHEVQGYYFSKPLDVVSCTQFLANCRSSIL